MILVHDSTIFYMKLHYQTLEFLLSEINPQPPMNLQCIMLKHN
jgi:hypothetical protein